MWPHPISIRYATHLTNNLNRVQGRLLVWFHRVSQTQKKGHGMGTSRFSGWAAAGGGVGGGDGWGGRLPVMAATAPPHMPGCDADCALLGLHSITPLYLSSHCDSSKV